LNELLGATQIGLMPNSVAINLKGPFGTTALKPIRGADNDAISYQVVLVAVIIKIIIKGYDGHALGQLNVMPIFVLCDIAVRKAKKIAEEAIEISAQFLSVDHAHVAPNA
jgi:hypothetical protein